MVLIAMRMVITFIGRRPMCPEEGQDGIVRSREQTRNFTMMRKFSVGAHVWLAWFDSILYSISFLYLCYSKLHTVYLLMSAPRQTVRIWGQRRYVTWLCTPNAKHMTWSMEPKRKKQQEFSETLRFQLGHKRCKKTPLVAKSILAKGPDWTKMTRSGSHRLYSLEEQ